MIRFLTVRPSRPEREHPGQERPELMLGNIPGNGNQNYLEEFRRINPGHDPSFLVKDGEVYEETVELDGEGRFVRGAQPDRRAHV